MAMMLRLRAFLGLDGRKKRPPREAKASGSGSSDAAAAQTHHRQHHIGASRGEASVTALAHARSCEEAQRALPGLRRDMRRAERLARRSSTVLE
ncbi:hypothetical protein G6O67_002458 [Ophiocordyceps sinensis]|uniref:Uncharacterized protein n=1 Tax=Ophiocordyceps sinensis TaxID=72228 RepID=A0A8H4PU94_9HYPO|nr:hypothetical protein G6O67_002458 [Ophiocordyceps sinensis]